MTRTLEILFGVFFALCGTGLALVSILIIPTCPAEMLWTMQVSAFVGAGAVIMGIRLVAFRS